MSLPGTLVTSRESAPSRGVPPDTGTLFLVGLADRGRSDQYHVVRNMSQVELATGGRVSYGLLWDALDVFFREGGSRAIIGRVVGPNPVVATFTLQDGTPANTLRIDAVSPGAWANGAAGGLNVTVAAGSVGGTFTLTVKENGVIKEVSPDLADNTAAVSWASQSRYIRATDLGGADPAVGNHNLAGGDDDRANITDAQWLAALNLFTKDLGPGQVAAPGRTTTVGHTQLLQHAQAKNRHALLDMVDTSTVATLTAEAATLRALEQNRYGAPYAPWAVVPGVAPGTTRTVPYSAVQAGLIARSEAKGNSPNIPAAGENGQSLYAIDLSQDPWSDVDRETLNDAGINVARILYGGVRTYGNRTLVDPLVSETWLQASNSRLSMAIASLADAIAERFLFAQIDGRGKKISEFGGELVGMLLPFWEEGSLFGATAEEAFVVDVGGQVNTPETIAARELHAVLAVKMSPADEQVEIEIAKVANTEVL